MSRAAARAGVLLALFLPAVVIAGSREKRKMTMKRADQAGPGTDLAASLIPSPASPLVTLRVQIRVGSIDDPPGKEGLNGLTALALAKGGTGDLSYRQVTDRLYPMAATIDVQFDREATTFIGEVHRDHLEEFYRLFTGLLLAPRFDERDVARNRDLLLAGIRTTLRGNDDEALGKEALGLFMYQGHPYGRIDLGTVRGLESITPDDIRAHYRTHYAQNGVHIGLAGDYPDGLEGVLREALTALPEEAPPRPPLPRPRSIDGMEIVIVEKPAMANAISMGFPIEVTRAGRDYYALLVANSHLGEHRTFNGRLMNKMRGERGLNYGDYSYIETFLQDGGSTFPLPNIPRRQQAFTVWIRPVAPENTLFALRQATREVARLAERGLTQVELDQTRTYLMNYSRLWTQSLSRRLGVLMDSRFYDAPFLVDAIQKELPRLTLKEVNEAVKRHLAARGIQVVIVAENAAELKRLLLSGKPTPIAYQTPTTDEALLAEDAEIQAYPLPVSRERLIIVSAQDLFER